MTSLELVAKERKRQVLEEGFTSEKDDKLGYGELALAGISYASPIQLYGKIDYQTSIQFMDPYPWTGGIGDKRKDYATDPYKEIPEHRDLKDEQKLDLLVKGAALICAEIDRLLRGMNYGK